MGYIVCNNGHYYEDVHPTCPYCPKPKDAEFNKKQIMNNDKTRILQGNEEKTIIQTEKSNDINRFNKTVIFSEQPVQEVQQQFQNLKPQNIGRKLVGWLVSYTLDPLGQDFKLREGRNIIGSDQACDIVIPDNQVSGKHLTILYRMGEFKFKDELSTNGTFVNDTFVEEGVLKDGDVIRIGQTVLKFRTAL